MDLRGWRRTVAAVASALGLACSLPGQPAAEASTHDGVHWVLHPQESVIHHDGRDYRVRVWITDAVYRQGENEREQAIQVVISRSSGGGDLRAVQKHFFTFSTLYEQNQWFSHRADLSGARLRAEQHLNGDKIRLDMQFAAKRPATSSCHGHVSSRTGRLTGTVLFRAAKSRIGDVTALSQRAKLTHGDGTCTIGETPSPRVTAMEPCPATTSVALGETSPRGLLFLIARRDPDSATATINVEAHENGPPTAVHTIEAVVPADRVQIAEDFRSIRIRGGRGTFVHGTANAYQSGPPTPWVASAGCPDGASAEASMQAPEGSYSGDFTARFFMGGYRSVTEIRVEATAYKNIEQR